uniref:Protein kinase domain-containing protein n=1 Tax=Chenopodium quinoa TaxID=63459 RepID=A0A803KMV4_CHEQI
MNPMTIICNTSFLPPKPFLPVHDLRFEVMDINWEGRYSDISPEFDDEMSRSQTLLVKNVFHNICRSDNGGITDSPVVQRVDLRGTPFLFSTQLNVFVAKGCGASLVLKNSSSDVVTGCASVCTNNISKNNMTNCNGVGCCQSMLSSSTDDIFYGNGEDGLDYYEIDMNHEALSNPQTCNVAAGLLDIRRVTEFSGSYSSFTTVLEWSGPFMSDNFDRNTFGFGSLTCSCSSNHPFEGCVGNPYLGCQLVRECQKCKHGCTLDMVGTTPQYVCKKHQLFNLASILGFSVSTGLVMLLLVCYWLYRLVKRIKEVRLKAKFFKRNGGLLLQQQISSRNGIVDKTRIFGFCELEKATNNFSEDRILGQGGQESASALSYLHSSSSAPIYHRDVKSSNILLDEKYRAKVSDFGTSRAITIEETHVTTCVQGTYGYLDPEYFQSNQFTEKSDLYSFGVVLVELITGKKPIYPNKSGGYISLATEFLFLMENSCVSDIFDPSLSEEAKEEELTAVANLAKQCLNMNGKQRPSMKEVALLLDGIRSPYVSKPTKPEYLKSDCEVMECSSPFSRGTSFSDNSPCTSLSIEALPLMAGN